MLIGEWTFGTFPRLEKNKPQRMQKMAHLSSWCFYLFILFFVCFFSLFFFTALFICIFDSFFLFFIFYFFIFFFLFWYVCLCVYTYICIFSLFMVDTPTKYLIFLGILTNRWSFALWLRITSCKFGKWYHFRDSK